MMQAQNQIRMGVATAAGDDYQKAVERYNAANDKMAERKAGLAEKLISNKTSQQIVEAQMKPRPTTFEQQLASLMRSGMSEGEATKLILGMSKTGAAGETTYSTEWTRASLPEKMKLRQQGINTIQDYIAYRERGGSALGGGAMGGAANDPLGLRNP